MRGEPKGTRLGAVRHTGPELGRKHQMPRILGLNIIAVIVATLAFYMLGALWYGALFSDLWVGLWGFTEAQLAS